MVYHPPRIAPHVLLFVEIACVNCCSTLVFRLNSSMGLTSDNIKQLNGFVLVHLKVTCGANQIILFSIIKGAVCKFLYVYEQIVT